jgi:hypothetical protein
MCIKKINMKKVCKRFGYNKIKPYLCSRNSEMRRITEYNIAEWSSW